MVKINTNSLNVKYITKCCTDKAIALSDLVDIGDRLTVGDKQAKTTYTIVMAYLESKKQ